MPSTDTQHYEYDNVSLHDMTIRDGSLYFECPCGDEFVLTIDAFIKGDRIAQCPTCSLTIRIECSDEELAKVRETHQSVMVTA